MSRDALVIGINTYSYLHRLNTPATDAEAVARILEKQGDFRTRRLPEAIEGSKIKFPRVSNTLPVTRLQLEKALEQLFMPNGNQAPETALFYFSGHGIPDKKGYDKGYLATSESTVDNPSSGLSLRWLQWLLSESQVRQQIIWLDCCNSGAVLVNFGAINTENTGGYSRCLIASSRDFENSWEDLNSHYSVLTKSLLEGLDASRLPGRWVDTFSLIDYINQALKGELQTPMCSTYGEAINLTRDWTSSAISQESLSVDRVEHKKINSDNTTPQLRLAELLNFLKGKAFVGVFALFFVVLAIGAFKFVHDIDYVFNDSKPDLEGKVIEKFIFNEKASIKTLEMLRGKSELFVTAVPYPDAFYGAETACSSSQEKVILRKHEPMITLSNNSFFCGISVLIVNPNTRKAIIAHVTDKKIDAKDPINQITVTEEVWNSLSMNSYKEEIWLIPVSSDPKIQALEIDEIEILIPAKSK